MGLVIGVLLYTLPVALLFATIIYLPFFIINQKQKRKLKPIKHFMIFAFIVTCLIILRATIFLGNINFSPGYYFLNLEPFIWLRETYDMGWFAMTSQIVLNACMFIPFGLLIAAAFPSYRSLLKIAVLSLSFSILIEGTQYFIGRSCDIDDVIMNVLGGIVGYGLFLLLDKLLHKNKLWCGLK